MRPRMNLVAFYVIITAFLAFQCGEGATINNIGINYGQLASNLPSPQKVVQLIKSTSIRRMKLYDANPMILGAFGSSGVEFVVGVKNEEISSLLDAQVALKWVSENVALYMKTSPISIICVGNEVLSLSNSTTKTQLVMAMRNIYAALQDLKLEDRVAVSSPHSMEILSQSFPPSSGEFTKEIVNPVMLPMLRFLNQTKCPLMMNIYPYFSYKAKPLDVSLAYALFLPNNGVTDPKTKLHYDNLFDAQLDAVYAAMGRLGFTNVPVVVSETGWPSSGSPIELGTNVANAMAYNRNLVKHIQSGVGTPMRPKQTPLVYIFSLFNENLKQGPTSERNFGIFRPGDLTAIYDIGILQGGSMQPSPPPLVIPIPRPPPPTTIPVGKPPPPTTIPTRKPPPPPLIIPIPRPPPPKLIIPIPRSPPPSTPSYPSPGIQYAPPPNRYPSPPSVRYPPPSIRYAPPPLIPYVPPSIQYAPPPPVSTCPPTITPPNPSYPPPMLTPPNPIIYPSPPPPISSTPSYPPPMVPYPPIIMPSPPYVPSPTPPTPGSGGGTHIWCVAKPGSDLVTLMAGLNYACGEGGADCSQIQPGGSCFYPDTLASHASFAFNSYYQRHGRNYWNCYFSGNALVTVTDPSSGSCVYPAQ